MCGGKSGCKPRRCHAPCRATQFSTHASIPAPAPSSARPTIANGVLTSCFLSLLLPSIRLQTPLVRVQDNSGIAIATIIRDNGCSCDC